MDTRSRRDVGLTASQDRAARTGSGFWRLAAFVFVASAIATLAFRAAVPSRLRVNESSDYFEYYEPVARQLVAGHGIVTPDGKPALRTPPGYPLFLALGFAVSGWTGVSDDVALATLCLLCMCIASIALFGVAGSIWGSAPSLLTAAAWITYPLALWLTKQPNSEMPFLVVFYLAVFLFVTLLKRRKPSGALALAVGLLIGVSMLIRPIAVGVELKSLA